MSRSVQWVMYIAVKSWFQTHTLKAPQMSAAYLALRHSLWRGSVSQVLSYHNVHSFCQVRDVLIRGGEDELIYVPVEANDCKDKVTIDLSACFAFGIMSVLCMHCLDIYTSPLNYVKVKLRQVNLPAGQHAINIWPIFNSYFRVIVGTYGGLHIIQIRSWP